jgi:hypothetical protein
MGSQMFEQQSVSVVQVPASAIQQVPLLHVPVVHVPQIPPQPSSPQLCVALQLGVQHIPLTQVWPEVHVETQVPLIVLQSSHGPQGAAIQTAPQT